MLSFFGNHFRLIFRLMRDRRVSLFLKLVFIIIPLGYVFYPTDIVDDYYPLIGLLDDLLVFLFASIIFIYTSPYSVVHSHRTAIDGKEENGEFNFEDYRYKKESSDLSFGFGVVMLLFLVGGEFGGIALLLIFAATYFQTLSAQRMMRSSMIEVNEHQYPEIFRSYEQAQSYLPKTDVKIYIMQSQEVNAFTMGLQKPFPIVLHSALVEKMKPEELQAIIGHEMGHIILGHTRLNSLLHSPGSKYLNLLFLKWSRSAEFSADAIAWVASGKRANYVVSALMRLISGIKNDANVDMFLNQTGKIEDSLNSIAEFFSSTHPLMKKRIKNILELEKNNQKG